LEDLDLAWEVRFLLFSLEMVFQGVVSGLVVGTNIWNGLEIER